MLPHPRLPLQQRFTSSSRLAFPSPGSLSQGALSQSSDVEKAKIRQRANAVLAQAKQQGAMQNVAFERRFRRPELFDRRLVEEKDSKHHQRNHG